MGGGRWIGKISSKFGGGEVLRGAKVALVGDKSLVCGVIGIMWRERGMVGFVGDGGVNLFKVSVVVDGVRRWVVEFRWYGGDSGWGINRRELTVVGDIEIRVMDLI
ncbi:hypothetical protein Tco_0569916 [Tanacetum coccineum]